MSSYLKELKLQYKVIVLSVICR